MRARRRECAEPSAMLGTVQSQLAMSDATITNFDSTPFFGGSAPNNIGKYEIAGMLG